MKRRLMDTNDGSKTIYVEDLDETYHSFHGAIQEANHVFITHGLKQFEPKSSIHIFEMGFGTGLNALLTWMNSKEMNLTVQYTGIEAYPVEEELLKSINYPEELKGESDFMFKKIHGARWNELEQLNTQFSILKMHNKIEDFIPESETIDLIYFDAFGPRAQEEMWDLGILKKMYELLKTNGLFLTYCAKGQVKRDLKSLGFEIQSLPGPPGKREMIRAIKV